MKRGIGDVARHPAAEALVTRAGYRPPAREIVDTGLRGTEVRRQVLDLDGLRGRHHGEPVGEVLQLPDVARKRQRCEIRERRFRYALGLDAEIARTLLQEVPREERYVFAAFAQRRQAQADHIEPVIQVLPEKA